MSTASQQFVEHFVAKGFKRARSGLLRLPLDADTSGVLALGKATKGLPPGWVQPLPMVWIRRESAMLRATELYEGLAPPAAFRDMGMYSRPLYLLAGREGHPEWFLTGGDEPDRDAATLSEMSTLMEAFGIPWLRRVADIDELLSLIVPLFEVNQDCAVYWPILLEGAQRFEEAAEARRRVLAVYETYAWDSAEEVCIAMRRMDESSAR